MNDGSIYVIESGGLCKIGMARDPERRLMQMRVGSALPMMMINHWHVEFPNDVETRLHKAYAAHRTHGEWFRLPREEIAWLRSVSDLTRYIEQWFDPWQWPPETRDANLERESAKFLKEAEDRRRYTFTTAHTLPAEFRARMVQHARLDRSEAAGGKDHHEG